jgi:hypothetical protein
MFSKTTNSLDRYDEIISKEFTLIDDEGNVVIKLSELDFKYILGIHNGLTTMTEEFNIQFKILSDKYDTVLGMYTAQRDSINSILQKSKLNDTNSNERILNQINSQKEELNALQKQYEAYKKETNRKLDDTMITKFPKIEAEIKKVNDRIDAILEFDVMKKEVKKNKKAYYLP